MESCKGRNTKFRDIEMWNRINIEGLHFIISHYIPQEYLEGNSFSKALRNTLMMRAFVSLVGSMVASLSRMHIRMGNNSLISKGMIGSQGDKG